MSTEAKPAVTQTNSAPAIVPAPTSAIAAKPADAKGGEPAATVSPTQLNAVGDAAKGEKAAILQACIDALAKFGSDTAKVCGDFLKTALAAIGQANETEELCECVWYCIQVAKETGDNDSPEAITAGHSCLKVIVMASNAAGYQLCSAKDGAAYIPKAKRGAVVAQPISTEAAPAATVEVTQLNSAPPAEVKPTVEATPAPAPKPEPTQPIVAPDLSQLNAAKDQEIADLKARLAAIPSGAKPIPSVPGNVSQQLSWPQAVEEVRKQLNSADVTPQVYAEAARRFPQLCQEQKVVREQGVNK